MEIKFTPVTYEAYLRSLKPIDTAPQFPATSSVTDLTCAPLQGPTPPTSSNKINLAKVVLGAIVVVLLYKAAQYIIRENSRED
jgi:hypothetical protein